MCVVDVDDDDDERAVQAGSAPHGLPGPAAFKSYCSRITYTNLLTLSLFKLITLKYYYKRGINATLWNNRINYKFFN